MPIVDTIPGFTTSPETTQQDSTTAQPTVTTPTTTPQEGQNETEERLSPNPGEGIITGRMRYTDEDEANLVTRQAIQLEAVKLTRVVTQAASQSSPQAASSSSEVVAQATNRIYPSQRRTNDVVRALQKLQRSCNHTYDRVSRRCLYCTKHRDSHVYDTDKLILNQS
jgi:hypothetical protein